MQALRPVRFIISIRFLGSWFVLIFRPVAKLRKEKNFPELECFVIDVISATSANLDAEDMEMLREAKMSSTFIREYLVSRALNKKDK